ncbi:hypothetical protein RV03_GL000765 [Enterococcus gallinarum]|nr:hypothetical protein RV03_GL000765 [Enterococcus gallinarum]
MIKQHFKNVFQKKKSIKKRFFIFQAVQKLLKKPKNLLFYSVNPLFSLFWLSLYPFLFFIKENTV